MVLQVSWKPTVSFDVLGERLVRCRLTLRVSRRPRFRGLARDHADSVSYAVKQRSDGGKTILGLARCVDEDEFSGQSSNSLELT